MNTFFLSSSGLNHSEQQTLQAVLTLSERALSASWHYRQNAKEANVVFAFLQSAEGLEFWQKHPQSAPVVVACSSHMETDTKWKLKLSAGHVPSRRELVSLLNDLSTYLAMASAIPVPTSTALDGKEDGQKAGQPQPSGSIRSFRPEPTQQPEPHPANPAIFDPDKHFLGLLRQAIAGGRDTAFALPQGRNWLMVYPQARKFYSSASATELQTLLLSGIGDIRQRELETEEQPDPALATHALADLLWQATLSASCGRLQAGRTTQDIVRLKHWPQVAHLPGYRQFLRVTSFMIHNAASLETVAQFTGTPLAQLIDFHNACEAIGLLERHSEADLVVKEADGQMRELSRKITSRLARPSLDRAA